MITILKKKFKEHSRQPIEKIKKMQHIYSRDLIQPRIEGELNPEFVQEYGAKNLNIDYHDVKHIEKELKRRTGAADSRLNKEKIKQDILEAVKKK